MKVPEDILKKSRDYYAISGQAYYFPDYYLPICDFFLDEGGMIDVKYYFSPATIKIPDSGRGFLLSP